MKQWEKIMKKLNRKINPSLFSKMHTMASKDLRLGQMMCCVFTRIKQDGKDPFYIENDEMEKYFNKAFNLKDEE